MRIFISLLSLFYLLVNFSFAQNQKNEIQIGDKAPSIKISKIITPANLKSISLEKLIGKIVILEFWATWCSPCVASIPHLDSLNNKFKDKAVQIITITKEDQKAVERFLSKIKQNLLVALDNDGEIFKKYGVRTVPHTVVIDKKGKIAAITEPEEITEKVIDDLLTGKKISVKPKSSISDEEFKKITEDNDSDTISLVKAVIKQSIEGNAFSRQPTADSIKPFFEANIPLLPILAYAYEKDINEIIDSVKSDSYYYVYVTVPRGNSSKLRPLLRNVIETGLNIETQKVTKKTKVGILTIDKGKPLKMTPSTASKEEFSFKGPKFNAVKQPINNLINYISNFKRCPIIDETGLSEKYDYSLDWVFSDRTTLDSAVSNLGLKLTIDERPIEMLLFKRTK